MVAVPTRDHESRPAGNGTASNAVDDDAFRIPPTSDADGLPRCVACRHRIYTPESLAAGMGAECRRRLRRALRDADPEVVAAVLAAIAALSGVVA